MILMMRMRIVLCLLFSLMLLLMEVLRIMILVAVAAVSDPLRRPTSPAPLLNTRTAHAVVYGPCLVQIRRMPRRCRLLQLSHPTSDLVLFQLRSGWCGSRSRYITTAVYRRARMI